MSVRITEAARDQYWRILSSYLRSTPRRSARPTAAQNLIDAYERAIALIEAGPRVPLAHPRPYPHLAASGFQWIKVHRYWFGYVPGADPIIANILDETSDMPRRLSVDRTPIDLA